MSQDKLQILLFCRYYLPGRKGGGPIRQFENLVNAIGDQFQFNIVTLDRDLGSSAPYDAITTQSWSKLGRARVFYIAEDDVTNNVLSQLIEQTSPDLIYLNSLWDRCFTAGVLSARGQASWANIPLLFAVRGGLNPAAFAINGLAKRLYVFWLKLSGRLRSIVWHATTDLEAQIMERTFGNQQGFGLLQSPDLSVAARRDIEGWKARAPGKPLRLALLARVAPIKNVEFAIEALGHCNLPVELTIYGPKEDQAYVNRCEALSANLPPHCTVNFAGELDGNLILDRLAAHDAFILPTKGENYGHAIAEALAAGLPVLVSDRTPWADRSKGGGCIVRPLENGPSTWAQVIDDWAMMEGAAMENEHRSTLEWAQHNLQTEEQMAEQLQLFVDAIASAKGSGC
jgi:glycosyltransferase involved in cell wall biosynthesis